MELRESLSRAANRVPLACHPSTWRMGQEDQEFEAILSHMVSSGLARIKGLLDGGGAAQSIKSGKHSDLSMILRIHV